MGQLLRVRSAVLGLIEKARANKCVFLSDGCEFMLADYRLFRQAAKELSGGRG
jgi:hypothetical protein